MEELETLFKVKKNQVRMMMDRGYNVGDEARLFEFTFNDFQNLYLNFAKSQNITIRDALNNIYFTPNKETTFVKYMNKTEKGQLGKDDVRSISETLISNQKYNIRNVIIITDSTFSSSAMNDLESMKAYNIQIFELIDFTYVPIDNYLVPKHEILTDEEAKKIQQSNKIPKIKVTDPIAKYYGAKKGNIFKIYRKDLTGTQYVQESIAYRLVV